MMKPAITQTIRKRPGGNKKVALDQIPSMAEFMHKRKVLHQYRHLLQASRKLEDTTDQSWARQEIQGRFRRLQFETDSWMIQLAMKEGQRELTQLQAMVGLGCRNTNSSNINNNNDSHEDYAQKSPHGTLVHNIEWPWQTKS